MVNINNTKERPVWGAPFSVSFGAGDTLTFRGNTVFCPKKFGGTVDFCPEKFRGNVDFFSFSVVRRLDLKGITDFYFMTNG